MNANSEDAGEQTHLCVKSNMSATVANQDKPISISSSRTCTVGVVAVE